MKNNVFQWIVIAGLSVIILVSLIGFFGKKEKTAAGTTKLSMFGAKVYEGKAKASATSEGSKAATA